jgi:hypothetical protein
MRMAMERSERPSRVNDDVVQTKATREAPRSPDPAGVNRAPPVQAKGGEPMRAGAWEADDRLMSAMGLQMKGGDGDTAGIHSAAAHGISGGGSSLPHADAIQKSFGPSHDVSQVQAHVGGAASDACDAIGASAYATGNHVAFKGAPDLHTAAHEAAHVIQQRQGVSLYGGVGQAGDTHEQHADAVADRVVQGKSAADLLSAGSGGGGGGGGAAVQRDEAPKPAAPPTDAGPAKPADAGAGAGGAKKGNETRDLNLTAIYEEVAGESKDKQKLKKGDDALWLDPINYFSNSPFEKTKKAPAVGVVTGGQTPVDTFQAPVGGEKPIGRGSITAEIKYASSINSSFDVTVDGVKKKDEAAATKMARAEIEKRIQLNGDIEDLEAAVSPIVAAKYEGAVVHIKVKPNKVMDAGSTTFYYKLRSNAGIEMNIKVVPIGEKNVKWGGETQKEEGKEDETSKKEKKADEKAEGEKTVDDKYKKKEKSTELTETEYNEKTTKAIDDYVTKTTTVRTELASDLSETVVKDKKSHWEEHTETSKKEKEWSDWVKSSKHEVEEGDKNKSNWAAKLQKGVKIAKKVTSIPFVDKIPGVGWLTRRVKGWQLDLLDAGLGMFAEEGKVHYIDTKLDEKVKSKGGKDEETKKDSEVDLKEHDETETKRKLKEDFLSKTQEDWTRHMDEVQEVKKTYKNKVTKEGETDVDAQHKEGYKDEKKKNEVETEEKHKQKKNQTTIATWQGSTTWKYTKPAVQATVFSGDAEVSNQMFPEDPAEKAGAADANK